MRIIAIFMLLSAASLGQVAGSGVPVLGSTQGAGGGLGGGSCGTSTTYAYSNSITIPAQGGLSADVSNFDLYLTGSTKWATVANGGQMQKSDGSDLIFCTTASGAGGTQLYSEREPSLYVTTTGAGLWHVFLGSTVISKTVTTTIYYYIGASSALDWSNPFNVPGSVTTGSFIVGETLTNVGGHTAKLLKVSPFLLNNYTAGFGFAAPGDTWTGGTSGATYTQSSIPTALVWPNYLLVLHYGTAASLTLVDSTNLNGQTNINTATATAGKDGGAVALVTASSQNINVSPYSGGNLFNVADVSFMSWINGTSFPNAYNSVMANENLINSGFTFLVKSTGKVAVYMDGPGPHYDGTGTNTLSTGTTYFVGFSYKDSTATVTGYVNGAQDGTNTAAAYNQVTNMKIGSGPSTGRFWNGWIDESRVCNCVLSADYHLATYNNQNSPGTFYTIN